jgi:hypothetical protein
METQKMEARRIRSGSRSDNRYGVEACPCAGNEYLAQAETPQPHESLGSVFCLGFVLLPDSLQDFVSFFDVPLNPKL